MHNEPSRKANIDDNGLNLLSYGVHCSDYRYHSYGVHYNRFMIQMGTATTLPFRSHYRQFSYGSGVLQRYRCRRKTKIPFPSHVCDEGLQLLRPDKS